MEEIIEKSLRINPVLTTTELLPLIETTRHYTMFSYMLCSDAVLFRIWGGTTWFYKANSIKFGKYLLSLNLFNPIQLVWKYLKFLSKYLISSYWNNLSNNVYFYVIYIFVQLLGINLYFYSYCILWFRIKFLWKNISLSSLMYQCCRKKHKYFKLQH